MVLVPLRSPQLTGINVVESETHLRRYKTSFCLGTWRFYCGREQSSDYLGGALVVVV